MTTVVRIIAPIETVMTGRHIFLKTKRFSNDQCLNPVYCDTPLLLFFFLPVKHPSDAIIPLPDDKILDWSKLKKKKNCSEYRNVHLKMKNKCHVG